jgi:hypothetical protein
MLGSVKADTNLDSGMRAPIGCYLDPAEERTEDYGAMKRGRPERLRRKALGVGGAMQSY